MEENKKVMDKQELNPEELCQIAGGSIKYTERHVRAAGIDLIKEDGTSGEFGYIWNSGDYYFKGKKLNDDEIISLIYFAKVYDHPAKTLQQALHEYHNDGGYPR